MATPVGSIIGTRLSRTRQPGSEPLVLLAEPDFPFKDEEDLADIFIESTKLTVSGTQQVRLLTNPPGGPMQSESETKVGRRARPSAPLRDALAEFKRRSAERDKRVAERLAKVRKILGMHEPGPAA